MMMRMLPRLKMTRYVRPLRRGGSLPLLVDTGAGQFVAKLRGTGHGARALIAGVITGQLARAAGLPVADLALLELGAELECDEGDPEITELIAASDGLNLGVAWIDGASDAGPDQARAAFDSDTAADIVWFDAFSFNPDRTAASPNVLLSDRGPLLIDHGSALMFHHDWRSADAMTHADTPAIDDHLLVERAGSLAEADARMTSRLSTGDIEDAVAAVPDSWLSSRDEREAYTRILSQRLAGPRAFPQRAGRTNRERNNPGRPRWIRRDS